MHAFPWLESSVADGSVHSSAVHVAKCDLAHSVWHLNIGCCLLSLKEDSDILFSLLILSGKYTMVG